MDYTPKGNVANMMRFTLNSDNWTPSSPAQLGFDAAIESCSDTGHCRIGGASFEAEVERLAVLAKEFGEKLSPVMIGAHDSLKFTASGVVIRGIARLTPALDPKEVGRREGIEFSEIDPGTATPLAMTALGWEFGRAKGAQCVSAEQGVSADELLKRAEKLIGEAEQTAPRILAYKPPFSAEAAQVAFSLKELLTVAQMADRVSLVVVEYCMRAMEKIASEELAKLKKE